MSGSHYKVPLNKALLETVREDTGKVGMTNFKDKATANDVWLIILSKD